MDALEAVESSRDELAPGWFPLPEALFDSNRVRFSRLVIGVEATLGRFPKPEAVFESNRGRFPEPVLVVSRGVLVLVSKGWFPKPKSECAD